MQPFFFGFTKTFSESTAQRIGKECMMEKMNQRIVEFRDMEDVAEFVNAAGKSEYDVNVISGNLYVDAKSLLGVMSMGFARKLRVQYRDADKGFERALQKFCVA